MRVINVHGPTTYAFTYTYPNVYEYDTQRYDLPSIRFADLHACRFDKPLKKRIDVFCDCLFYF